MASKYDALAEHLRRQSGSRHTMSFDQMAQLIGTPLPPSAHAHRAWWANDRTHPQALNGWLAAGWEVDAVDWGLEAVTFRRQNHR